MDQATNVPEARRGRRPLQPLDEFRRIWKEQLIWNVRERAVLSVLIVLANNATGCVNEKTDAKGKKKKRYGQGEIARMAGLSKSSLLRALDVLCDPTKAGVVVRLKTKTSDGVNEINVYRLLSEKLGQWTGQDRPTGWNPPTKPSRGSVMPLSPAPRVATPCPAVSASCGDVAVAAEPALATISEPPPAAEPATPPLQPAEPPPPAPPRRTLPELAAARPGDDLLQVLNRGAEQGHVWCVKVAAGVLERGGVITPAQRKVLREIRDELARAATPTTTARPGMGTFRREGVG